jgi:serine/threonine protein phosphatase PrpC
MKVRVGARTDIGRARERNEDSYLVREPLFAVADGMGGHLGGEVASSMAIEALETLDRSDGLMQALVEEIQKANRRVLERGQGDPALRGMGTTLTVLVAEGDKAHVAHVGDSRAYLLRDGSLKQLTEDHTLVQRMVAEGRISPEEAGRHPQRSILTRVIGVDEEVPVEQLTLDVHGGDRLLLCTDGLTGMIGEERIQDVLETEPDPQAASDRLVEEANRAGGEDNITVVVVDFESEGGKTASHPSPGGTQPTVIASPGDGRGATAAAPSAPSSTDLTGVHRVPPSGAEVSAEPPPPPHRRRRWRRVVLWILVLLVLLGGAAVGARMYIDRQWYVGVSEGRVAIYNGVPTEVLGYGLSHVEESTDLPADDAMRLQHWTELDQGITASSLEDARAVVEQIREDLEATP